MSEQYTSEPWSLRDGMGDVTVKFIKSKNDNNIAGVKREDNARRIVACVNTCAGIPNESLEDYQNKGALKVLAKNIELEQQRDELLAALKTAAQIIGHPDDDFSKYLQELIVKAKS